ncbi:hypothetical protein [Deinococcus hopiensis]|uniref:hypothetical protein n=1 Tax=Deinococcus hopiensis TaxID=309885 RepID=UPI000A00D6A3|nr:hypothetical protein [Deinococcus hopiensis]
MTSTFGRPLVATSTCAATAREQRLLAARWLALHGEFGHASASFASLMLDVQALTVPGLLGPLPYRAVGQARPAAGNPLAPAEGWSDFARVFRDTVRAQRVTPALTGCSAAFARAAGGEVRRALRLGATPHLDAQR